MSEKSDKDICGSQYFLQLVIFISDILTQSAQKNFNPFNVNSVSLMITILLKIFE
jgi:hypothetical protein